MSVELTLNIPDSKDRRIVIIGAGFAGLTLARKLQKKKFQVVLIDKNNYHQFQPLYYQVAMAGLEPSSISFPLRKTFQNSNNVFIRIAEMESVNQQEKLVSTSQGDLPYDFLVIATGAVTNYFGNETFRENTYSLKSVSDSLDIRNQILTDFERALQVKDYDNRQKLIDIAIVGGGPTGVELAGSLAEMRKYILPKDYKELDNQEVDIYLIQGGSRLLLGMDEKLARTAEKYLKEMGVKTLLNTRVVDISENTVHTNRGENIVAGKVIWAAGVRCPVIMGMENKDLYSRGNRLIVNEYNQLKNDPCVFALGDAACMISEKNEHGHPQVAQPAIQQAKNVARNLIKTQGDLSQIDKWKPFRYKDFGTMATVGRNKAVVQLPFMKFKGFLAWLMWLFVHLYALVGIRNRVLVMLNWSWNYLTYDQSLRLIIRPKTKKGQESRKT